MATIINNGGGDDRDREPLDRREIRETREYREDGSGAGIVVGIIIAVLLIVFFVYFFPLLRSGNGTATPAIPNTGVPAGSNGGGTSGNGGAGAVPTSSINNNVTNNLGTPTGGNGGTGGTTGTASTTP